MTGGWIMGALRTSVHVMFAGSKPERAGKNGGNAWGSSPPKAEATGSNPVGCTKIQLSSPNFNALTESLANLSARLAKSLSAAVSESVRWSAAAV